MSVFISIPAAIITALLAGSPPPAVDACTLLTREVAAAALGEAVKGPEAIAEMSDGAGSTVSNCEYTGSGYHKVVLSLTRMSKQTASMTRKMCAEKASKDLAGLGDVACWYNEKHAELHAFKGDAFVSIEMTRDGDPTEAIKGVMKKAIDGLK